MHANQSGIKQVFTRLSSSWTFLTDSSHDAVCSWPYLPLPFDPLKCPSIVNSAYCAVLSEEMFDGHVLSAGHVRTTSGMSVRQLDRVNIRRGKVVVTKFDCGLGLKLMLSAHATSRFIMIYVV